MVLQSLEQNIFWNQKLLSQESLYLTPVGREVMLQDMRGCFYVYASAGEGTIFPSWVGPEQSQKFWKLF